MDLKATINWKILEIEKRIKEGEKVNYLVQSRDRGLRGEIIEMFTEILEAGLSDEVKDAFPELVKEEFRSFRLPFSDVSCMEVDGQLNEFLFADNEIDCLKEKNTILILDNINYSTKKARKHLIEFLKERTLIRADGTKVLIDTVPLVLVGAFNNEDCKSQLPLESDLLDCFNGVKIKVELNEF